MGDETQIRSGDPGDSRDGGGGSAGESAPLQARAAFLANWHWQSVIRLNERLCSGGRAQHGQNSETYPRCEAEWQQGHGTERTLLETLDWLRSFHRKAPFLFFNGNSFAEIARTLTDALFAEFPHVRRRQAASLAAHYVADFKLGDRVRTLKGSLRGTVKKILPDGRIAWKPDNSSSELLALPESLLRAK